MEDFYVVGVIAGTHGLRGEVRVLPRTDFPGERFKKGSVLVTRPNRGSDKGRVVVHSARPHKQFWLVAFEGYEDINLVENWKGTELGVSEADLMPLPEDTYYIHQLVGLDVKTDDGRYVGTIQDVLLPGANDVYVVRGPLQTSDVLIPAIPDCVLGVDLEEHLMTVHLLPGMLEGEEEGSTDA